MILLVDNYDSFTYNLVQRLGEIDPDVDLKVVRNDQFTIEQIEQAEAQPPHYFPRTLYARSSRDLKRRRHALRPEFPSWVSAWDTSASATPWEQRLFGPTESCTARHR